VFIIRCIVEMCHCPIRCSRLRTTTHSKRPTVCLSVCLSVSLWAVALLGAIQTDIYSLTGLLHVKCRHDLDVISMVLS